MKTLVKILVMCVVFVGCTHKADIHVTGRDIYVGKFQVDDEVPNDTVKFLKK